MRKLDEYIKRNNVEKCIPTAIPSQELVSTAENQLNFKFGQQMRHYLLQYGCLSFGYVEFEGISSLNKLESGIIFETESAKDIDTRLDGCVVIRYIEDLGYALVDSEDNVYLQLMACSEPPKPMNMKLEEYIIYVFEEVKETNKYLELERKLFDIWDQYAEIPVEERRPSQRQIFLMWQRLEVESVYEIDEYLRRYGIISYGKIQLFGLLNEPDGYLNIEAETEKMREKYSNTQNLIAFEKNEKGDYIAVDPNGEVFLPDEKGVYRPCGKKFYCFLLEQFEQENERLGKRWKDEKN